MFKNAVIGVAICSSVLLSGCASVPMASDEEDLALKQFTAPGTCQPVLYSHFLDNIYFT